MGPSCRMGGAGEGAAAAPLPLRQPGTTADVALPRPPLPCRMEDAREGAATTPVGDKVPPVAAPRVKGDSRVCSRHCVGWQAGSIAGHPWWPSALVGQAPAAAECGRAGGWGGQRAVAGWLAHRGSSPHAPCPRLRVLAPVLARQRAAAQRPADQLGGLVPGDASPTKPQPAAGYASTTSGLVPGRDLVGSAPPGASPQLVSWALGRGALAAHVVANLLARASIPVASAPLVLCGPRGWGPASRRGGMRAPPQTDLAEWAPPPGWQCVWGGGA